MFGMPGPDAFDTAPAWVRFAGCTILGRPAQRACDACGHEWDRLGPPTDVGAPPRRR